jgi:hypothetical protein
MDMFIVVSEEQSMNPIKVVTVALYGAGLGFAYLAKANAASKGRPTQVEDQAIEMGQERLKRALEM